MVEGERCVHALSEIGVVATTSPGGAGKAPYADWSPLAGKRAVYLWPDNDDPGRKHMQDVAAQLAALPNPPKVVKFVNVPIFDLPPKGDVVEFLGIYADGDAEEARRHIQCVQDTALSADDCAANELGMLLEDTISGKRMAIPFRWRFISRASRALFPGTLTVICGDPGTAKSFWLMDTALHWHAKGVPLAMYVLEEDRAFHLYRALAQLEENGDLTDDEWVREHPDETRAAFSKHRQFIGEFGKRIYDAPENPVTYEQLLDWIEDRCKAGCQIIAIDPITAVAVNDKDRAQLDLQFVLKGKALMRRYQSRLIVVTHPRGNLTRNETTVDGLAGGRAFGRFTPNVLWVKGFAEPRQVRVKIEMGVERSVSINRSVRVTKARSGPGQGCEIGFNFERSSLRFAEQGIVMPAKHGGSDED